MSWKYLKDSVTLFDNQKNNANGLYKKSRAILCDKVGSGKTLSVLAAYCALKERFPTVGRLLVFTPKSAHDKHVWKKDIDKFTNLRSSSLEDLTDLNAVDVVYAKHTSVKDKESFQKIVNIISNTAIVVIDECHVMRTPNTALTQAFIQLFNRVRPIRIWGITGTPLSRNLEDTYHIVNFINPGFLGTFWEYRAKYCKCIDVVTGYDRVKHQPKTCKKIVGVKDATAFTTALSPIVIVGESFASLQYQYVDYNLTSDEGALYEKLAHGINFGSDDATPEEWLERVLSLDSMSASGLAHIKNLERYSSRFIYLQYAADGCLLPDGTVCAERSTKIDLLIDLLFGIVDKKQSVLVYFDYYSSLEAVKRRLQAESFDAVILESSGKHVLADGDLTEDMCASKSHIVLCTKASAESASYYFINNVVLFHVPTVPHTFAQFNGRITRKNTLFPDDLHCYIFRSDNIDLYKLMLVSSKASQMEVVSGAEKNIPDTYKQECADLTVVDKMKKVLLWCK